jgi:hypothetical protein
MRTHLIRRNEEASEQHLRDKNNWHEFGCSLDVRDRAPHEHGNGGGGKTEGERGEKEEYEASPERDKPINDEPLHEALDEGEGDLEADLGNEIGHDRVCSGGIFS